MSDISAAERMYPNTPAPVAQAAVIAPPPRQEPAQAVSAPSATTPAAETVAPASEAPIAAETGTEEEAAKPFVEIPETRLNVAWDEPKASPGSVTLAPLARDEGWDLSTKGEAERSTAADAMIAAGAGSTFAQEVFRDVAAAYRPDFQRVTPEASIGQLQKEWGANYAVNIAAAQALVQKAAVKDPSIISHLERTGLGNDPAFIRKLAAYAARRR
jgi:hypothetical protein